MTAHKKGIRSKQASSSSKKKKPKSVLLQLIEKSAPKLNYSHSNQKLLSSNHEEDNNNDLVQHLKNKQISKQAVTPHQNFAESSDDDKNQVQVIRQCATQESSQTNFASFTNTLSRKNTKISRDIVENKDGSRLVKEVETSFLDVSSRVHEVKEIRKETVSHVMEVLRVGQPAKLLQESEIGCKRYEEIESTKNLFFQQFPNFTLRGVETNMQQFKEAIDFYAAMPFVDFSWMEILSTKVELLNEDVAKILLNKLIWNASKEEICQEEGVEIKLHTFNMEDLTAVVHLSVPLFQINHYEVFLDHVDPFLLMLLPEKSCRDRVRMATEVLAKNAFDRLT